MGIIVELAQEATDEIVRALDRLLPQLTTSTPPPTNLELERILSSPCCSLLVARDDENVVGMLTLVTFDIPTGTRAWIEDVVVDSSARGKGVGEILSRRALEIALDKGAVTVDLTSRPSREAANRLYQRIGFVKRDTNVYRYNLK